MTRLYRNPPVREALCEIYFTGSQWDAATQGLFFERIKGEYSVRQPVTEFGVEVRFTDREKGALYRESQSRMRYARQDGSRLVQLAPDLLVVNQLRPYPHFGEWRPVIGKMALLYSELAAPKTVRQVGVRYINEIVIPASGEVRLEEYFTVYPTIPQSMGGKHGPYMLRLEMPTAHQGHVLLITFAMAPPKGPSEMVFTLDLYGTYGLPFGFSVNEIEKQVDQAHEGIEHVFDSFSTQKLKELLGEVRNG